MCLAKSLLYTVCAVSLCVSAEVKVKPPHSLLPHSSTEYKQYEHKGQSSSNARNMSSSKEAGTRQRLSFFIGAGIAQ